MCKPVYESFHNQWSCAVAQCKSCPEHLIPEEEKGTSTDSPKFCFRAYKKLCKCTMHGFLPKEVSECQTCIDLRTQAIFFGKVSEKNTLVKRTETIGDFYVSFYIPLLYIYRDHGGLVKTLSKHRCYELW